MWNWLTERRPKKGQIDLETALASIPWTPFKILYNYKSENGIQTTVDSPFYCVPAKIVNGDLCIGLYPDHELIYVPVGFSLERVFQKEYFQGRKVLYSDRSPANLAPKPDLLYLPLQRSEVPIQLIYDRYDREYKVPSWLYSISNSKNRLPFSLLTDSHEGIQVYLYAAPDPSRSNSDTLALVDYFSFTQYPFQRTTLELFQEYFEQLKNGTYRFPKVSAQGSKLIVVKTFKTTANKKKEVPTVVTEKNAAPPSKTAARPSKTKSSESVTASAEEIDWRHPKSIKSYLDRFMIGQEDAKRTVAVAFSNYMIRVDSGNPDLPKDNVFLIGASGTGKTYLMSLLARKASIPFAQAKATGKSDEGFKGENLSSVFEQIRSKSKDEAPAGVVFIDEIDKLALRSDEIKRGPALQDEIIGWAEETIIYGETERPDHTKKPLNTKNLLFAIAGAFQGTKGHTLESIISARLKKKRGRAIGFANQIEIPSPEESAQILRAVTPEDLIEYGLKTELVGRFSSMALLHPLDQDQKMKILTDVEDSAIKKYQALFKEKGYSLQLEESVYALIAENSPEETGARGLRSLCSKLFDAYLFDPTEFTDDNEVILVTSRDAEKFIRGVRSAVFKA